MKKKYIVPVVETISTSYLVEANSEEEAREIVEGWTEKNTPEPASYEASWEVIEDEITEQ